MKLVSDFKKVSDQNEGHITILNRTGVETAVNKFKPGAPEDNINDLNTFFSTTLPPDYINFLQFCNGASLFEHPEYGGEITLFSVQDIIHYNEPADRKIVVANIQDDRIIIDLDLYQSGNQNYLLLCESMNPVEYSGSFNTNFETWLERFIVSQGSKFWYWKTDRYIF